MGINIYKFFLSPYLILISFNAAFALSEYLQVYILASIPLITFFLINVFSQNLPKNLFQIIDLPIVFFSINNIFIFILNPSSGALNYLFVYLYTFIFIYFSVKYYLLKIGWQSFIRISNIGLYLVMIFVILDFIFAQITGINIQMNIPRIGPSADSIVFGGFLRRAYGFSNEPTNLSAYFLSFGMLASFYNSKFNKKLYWPVIISLLIVSVLTYSTGLFISILIASFIILIYLLINTIFTLRINKQYIIFFITSLLFFSQIIIYFPEIFTKITSFETFMGSRGNYWLDTFNSIYESKFTSTGLGNAGSVINWYLMLLYENGLVSLLLIFAYILMLFLKVKNSTLSFSNKIFFYFGIISIYFQLNAFSNFYYPYYLIYSLVIYNIIDSNKEKKYKLIKNKELNN